MLRGPVLLVDDARVNAMDSSLAISVQAVVNSAFIMALPLKTGRPNTCPSLAPSHTRLTMQQPWQHHGTL